MSQTTTLPDGRTVHCVNAYEVGYGWHEVVSDDLTERGLDLPADGTYFDVGANIGLFCLRLHDLCPDGRIFAFEPMPAAFEALKDNAAAMGDKVKANRLALGAAPATSLLVPHRGVPLPTPEDFAGGAILATGELRFNGAWSSTPLDAARDACCFPSDSHACLHTHVQSREALRASTKLLRAAGALSLIPGEGNFLRMEYRACAHAPDGGGRACA